MDNKMMGIVMDGLIKERKSVAAECAAFIKIAQINGRPEIAIALIKSAHEITDEEITKAVVEFTDEVKAKLGA